jgi:hypothetical protein
MLGQVKSKEWSGSVRFVRAKVERLAEAGVTGPFDGVLAAFVLVELADLDAGLKVIHELLRPGAPLAVHERSVVGSLRSKLAWASMCWGVVIPLGGMVTGGAGLLPRALARCPQIRQCRRVRATLGPSWFRGPAHSNGARLGATDRAHLARSSSR